MQQSLLLGSYTAFTFKFPAGILGRKRTGKSLNILVLGGTQFVGPAIVEASLKRGHDVTLFNRGITNPELFPNIPKVRGNRYPGKDQGLKLLKDKKWDVVIDTWAVDPVLTEASTEVLKNNSEHYIYISSIAAYKDYNKIGINENYPLSYHVASGEDISYKTGKVLSEHHARNNFPEKHTIFRCHAILGPREDNDSLRYWLINISRNNEVLAPGTGEDFVQYTDVRDLGDAVIGAAEQKIYGTYNFCVPPRSLTMKQMLQICKEVTGSEAKLTWVPAKFLSMHNVYELADMPMWAISSVDGFMQIDNDKALDAGFTFRSFTDTATSEWAFVKKYFPDDYQLATKSNVKYILADPEGITDKRQKEILDTWKKSINDN